MRGPAARARNAGACSWSLQCAECDTQGWNGQMLRDYYGRAPPSFFDCCNAATGRSLMYTSVARLASTAQHEPGASCWHPCSAAVARVTVLYGIDRVGHCHV